MIRLFVWLLKTAAMIVVFHLVIPPVVHSYTKNSWVKLPVMMALGLCAGILMTWLHYMPFLLVFMLFVLSKYSLNTITSYEFQQKLGREVRPTVHKVSTYAYVLTACLSAWILQTEIAGAEPGEWVPVWEHVLKALS